MAFDDGMVLVCARVRLGRDLRALIDHLPLCAGPTLRGDTWHHVPFAFRLLLPPGCGMGAKNLTTTSATVLERCCRGGSRRNLTTSTIHVQHDTI